MVIKYNKNLVDFFTFVMFAPLLFIALLTILQFLKPSYVDESNYKWIVVGRFIFMNIITIFAISFSYRYLKNRKPRKKRTFKRVFSVIVGFLVTVILLLYVLSLYRNLINYGFNLQETNTICDIRKSYSSRGGYSYFLKIRTKSGTLEELSITGDRYVWFLVKYPNLSGCKDIPQSIRYEQVFYNLVW